MPNGGSDCCGTCWFNAKNKGEPGYDHVNDPEPDFCTIRDLDIQDAFYTYCANHPHRNPDKLKTPIGPVFIDETGHREVWVPSPGTEEVRQTLLRLLSAIQETPNNEYPIGGYLDEVVIWQLGEFRERRAISDLERIAAFDPDSKAPGAFDRTRASTVQLAKQALEQIQSHDSEST